MIFFGLYILMIIADSLEMFITMKNNKKAEYENIS